MSGAGCARRDASVSTSRRRNYWTSPPSASRPVWTTIPRQFRRWRSPEQRIPRRPRLRRRLMFPIRCPTVERGPVKLRGLRTFLISVDRPVRRQAAVFLCLSVLRTFVEETGVRNIDLPTRRAHSRGVAAFALNRDRSAGIPAGDQSSPGVSGRRAAIVCGAELPDQGPPFR